MNKKSLNVFAYGSLMWNPGFTYEASKVGLANGWERRFWQGSPDHRGTPEAPGRVVTLLPAATGICTGRIFSVHPQHSADVVSYLDARESGGYSRVWLTVRLKNGMHCRALTYVALSGNPHFLGPASESDIMQQIERSTGPSGANIDYWHNLARELNSLPCERSELTLISRQ